MAPPAIVADATPSHAMMEHHHEHMMAMLKKLNLSDAQMDKIKQLDASFHAAHPAGSPPDRKVAKAHYQAIMAILTPSQRDNLHRMMKNDKNHPGDSGH